MKAVSSIDDPRYVKAMSHPMRVRILAMLDERTASPNQLAGWLDASLGTVAYHVRTLLSLGLIELVHETRVRGAVEHHYRARPRPGISVDGWEHASPVARQAAVGSSLEVIGEYARASAAAGGFERSEAQVRRTLLKLDEKGFAQLSKACDKLLEQVERIEEQAAKRLGSDPARAVEARLGVLLFEAARLPAPTKKRARKRGSAPAAGSVAAGASTEG
jgi:DNA-binding transcriptional ArsR family regulator